MEDHVNDLQNPKFAKMIDDDLVIQSYDKKALLCGDFNAVLDAGNSKDQLRANLFHDYCHKKFLLKYLKPKKQDIILDFGTGMGRLSRLISPLVREITGVDRSKEMINLALENRDENIEYLLLKDQTIPKPDNYYDKIFSFWVLASIGDNLLKTVFDEFYRLLREGGTLVFFEQVSAKHEYEGNVHKKREIKEFLELARSSKFKSIHCKSIIRFPSYAMNLWRKYPRLPKILLPVLYRVEQLTTNYKPQVIEYSTCVFIFRK